MFELGTTNPWKSLDVNTSTSGIKVWCSDAHKPHIEIHSYWATNYTPYLDFKRQWYSTFRILTNGSTWSNSDRLEIKNMYEYNVWTVDNTLMTLHRNGSIAYPNFSENWRIELRADYTNPQIVISWPTSTNTNKIVFQNTYGAVWSIATNGSSTLYNTSSDYRLKENVVEMGNAVERVNSLRPVRFNFKTDKEVTVDWFIAHEVGEVIPEAVNWEKDWVDEEGNNKYQSMDYSKLTPLLTAGLQEALKEIEQLKKINSKLEERISVLENK